MSNSCSVDPLACPQCSNRFSSEEVKEPKYRHVSRYPLLLKCGHSVCRNCLHVTGAIHQEYICKTCEEITEFPDGSASVSRLMASKMLLSRIRDNVIAPVNNFKAMQMLNVNHTSSKSEELCYECQQCPAALKCVQCQALFCSKCWDKVHNHSKYMKNHKSITVDVEASASTSETCNKSLINNCQEHNKPLEFFCEDDDRLVCSHCAIMGNHKGHSLMTLSEKVEISANKLDEAAENGSLVQTELKSAHQEISTVIGQVKENYKSINLSVKTEFLKLHGLLEIREHKLLSGLDNYFAKEFLKLEQTRSDIIVNLKKLSSLMQGCQEALKSNKPTLYHLHLSNSLMEMKNLSVSSSVKEQRKSELKFNSSPECIEYIKSFGSINTGEECENQTDSTIATSPKIELDLSANNFDFPIGSSDSECSIVSQNRYEIASISAKSESASIISQGSTSSITSMTHISVPPPNPMSFHNTKVAVTHIVNPHEFWVTPMKFMKNHKILSSSLRKNHLKMKDPLNIPNLISVGDIYLAQYSEDKLWYRALVKAILSTDQKPEEQTVAVSFIDFGNTEKMKVKRLRKILDKQILQYPAMAWCCKLYDIMPKGEKWSSETVKIFHNILHEKFLIIKIIEVNGNVLIVDLTLPSHSSVTNDMDSSIRDALILLNLARFVTNPQEIETIDFPVKKIQPEIHLPLGSNANVSICHIDDPFSFHVQKMGAKASMLLNLMEEMQKLFNEPSGNALGLMCPIKGTYCAAKFSVDDNWYRVETVGDIEDSLVDVKYVDYGNTETVNAWELRKLPDYLMELPAQAIRCSLAGVAPVEEDWSYEANEFLASVTSKVSLRMVVKEHTERLSVVALLINSDNETDNVSSMMVKENLAKNISSSENKLSPIANTSCKIGLKLKDGSGFDTENPDTIPLNFKPSAALDNKKSKILARKKRKNKLRRNDHLYISPESETKEKVTKSSDNNIEKNSSNKTSTPYTPIKITHVESPSDLYLDLNPKDVRDGESDEKAKLMHDIQVEYSCVAETGNVQWNVEDVCCVKCVRDGLWYRAAITDMSASEDTAKVFLIDFGPTITVPIKDISMLEEQFHVSPFCVRCHLTDIIAAGGAKTWSHLACDFLKQLLTARKDVLFCVYPKNREKIKNSVSLQLYYQETIIGGALEPTKTFLVNISEKLVEEGLALPVRPNIKSKDEDTDATKESEFEEVTFVLKSDSQEEISLETTDNSQNGSQESLLLKGLEVPDQREIVQSCWKPAEKPKYKSFKCMPTYVDHNANIYLQDNTKGKQNLKIINQALLTKFRDSVPQHYDLYWVPGQQCIIKYHADNKWYRGEIMALKETGIKVKFIDYGNEENVDFDDLRKNIIMTQFPPQCMKYELHGLKSTSEDGKWSIPILDFIHQSIVDKVCTATIENFGNHHNSMKISLVIEPDIDLKTLLIEAQFALEKHEEEVIVESYDNVVSQNSFFLPPSIPEIDEIFPVLITQMITPHQVSIQRLPETQLLSSEKKDSELCDQQTKFLDITSEMQEKAKTWPIVQNLAEGHVCCGQYTHDDEWYRAKILKLIGDQYLVSYVDYGNCEVLGINRLRVLPEKLIDFPIQSISCIFYQFSYITEEWSAESSARMMDILFNSNNQLYAKIKALTPEVKIDLLVKDSNNQYVLAYQSLVENGIVTLVREKQLEEML